MYAHIGRPNSSAIFINIPRVGGRYSCQSIRNKDKVHSNIRMWSILIIICIHIILRVFCVAVSILVVLFTSFKYHYHVCKLCICDRIQVIAVEPLQQAFAQARLVVSHHFGDAASFLPRKMPGQHTLVDKCVQGISYLLKDTFLWVSTHCHTSSTIYHNILHRLCLCSELILNFHPMSHWSLWSHE